MDFGPQAPGERDHRLTEVANLPGGMAHLISKGLCTLHELQTVYGTEDFYNLLEIAAVESYNRRVMAEPR